MRRVQMLTSLDFVQPLKLKFNNPVALSSFTQVLPKLGFSKPTKKDYKIRAWAKFDAENFDGIQLISALSLNGRDKSISSAEFTVNSISIDDMWTETGIGVFIGTQAGKKFIASVPQSALDPVILSGDVSLKIDVKITILNNVYKDYFYINHLGIFDEMVRAKNKIKFLELTKADE
jgi:hypothetical protein